MHQADPRAAPRPAGHPPPAGLTHYETTNTPQGTPPSSLPLRVGPCCILSTSGLHGFTLKGILGLPTRARAQIRPVARRFALSAQALPSILVSGWVQHPKEGVATCQPLFPSPRLPFIRRRSCSWPS